VSVGRWLHINLPGDPQVTLEEGQKKPRKRRWGPKKQSLTGRKDKGHHRDSLIGWEEEKKTGQRSTIQKSNRKKDLQVPGFKQGKRWSPPKKNPIEQNFISHKQTTERKKKKER